MNFQQLEYLIAVSQTQHFGRAADKCFVTQPTLSMMIQKLEKELDVLIFDRSKKPIVPTVQGAKIINQAKLIIKQRNLLIESIQQEKGSMKGQLHIGIIPTLAPYLMPLFVKRFTSKYPEINFVAEEINTATIIEKLQQGNIDIGILATPLQEKNILEFPLFYEEFFLYGVQQLGKQFILPEDINLNELLLLEEGHCLRTQAMHICQLKEKMQSNFSYKSGSLETLRRLVELDQGITILPELALKGLDETRVLPFHAPVPTRQISLVRHTSFFREKLFNCLFEEIQEQLPDPIRRKPKGKIIPI